MSRVRYTVISIARGLHEPAWREQGARSVWLLTLSDSAGKRHLLEVAQPSDQPIPAIAGAVWELDARLVSPEAEAKEKGA